MNDDLRLARRAALAGADVAMRYFGALAGLRRELKLDGSVVTEADRAVEAAVRAVLAGARPHDAVLGEEEGLTGDPGGRRWIVDPIDGTALFVEGDVGWLVLVALEEDGEVTTGVAVHPAQRRIWWARRGEGAWEGPLDGPPRRIAVAAPGNGTRLGVLPMTGGRPRDAELVAGLLEVTPASPWHVHPPLLVARGDLDVAVQTSGAVWDFAATSLIVAEAGGAYRNSAGGRRPAAGPSVFARDDTLADATVELLRPDAGVQGVDQREQRAQ